MTQTASVGRIKFVEHAVAQGRVTATHRQTLSRTRIDIRPNHTYSLNPSNTYSLAHEIWNVYGFLSTLPLPRTPSAPPATNISGETTKVNNRRAGGARTRRRQAPSGIAGSTPLPTFPKTTPKTGSKVGKNKENPSKSLTLPFFPPQGSVQTRPLLITRPARANRPREAAAPMEAVEDAARGIYAAAARSPLVTTLPRSPGSPLPQPPRPPTDPARRPPHRRRCPTSPRGVAERDSGPDTPAAGWRPADHAV